MSKHFQIGEIAQFFQIPASTLRYWEEKGILKPNQDQNNHYRSYCIEDFMTISDIIFYKNLGLPLKHIKEMEETSVDEHALLFEDLMTSLKNEQAVLEQRMQKLRHHMQAIDIFHELTQYPYQITDIDTDCIVSFEFLEADKLYQYINNPYLYSRVQYSHHLSQEQRGLTIDKKDANQYSEEEIIWKKQGQRYMTFLMREEISEGFPNDLKEHLAIIEKQYHTGAVISRFLLCAKENGKVYDFYKTFVEIKEK